MNGSPVECTVVWSPAVRLPNCRSQMVVRKTRSLLRSRLSNFDYVVIVESKTSYTQISFFIHHTNYIRSAPESISAYITTADQRQKLACSMLRSTPYQVGLLLVSLVSILTVQGFRSSLPIHQREICTKKRRLLHPTLFLFKLSSSDDDPTKAKVRFSSTRELLLSNNNVVDSALAFVTSDIGSIVLGLTGVVLLLVGRLVLDNDSQANNANVIPDLKAMGQETRSNLLALFACGSVLVNGISRLDVSSALAESVVLVGTDVGNVEGTAMTTTIQWALTALKQATPASSVVLLQLDADTDRWHCVARTGILPDDDTVRSKTPILDRFRNHGAQESYLPTLQAIPGKTEFSYLPVNTQAVLILPAGTGTALVLGANRARSFSPKDIAWCTVIGARLGEERL
jgi:hypothetical protein